jgi:hypothetical protein
MAVNPSKRQKKLERRAARRAQKRHQANQQKNFGMGQRMAAAAGYPILDCCATEDLWTEGLGWVLLSRQLPNGSIALSMFLVDRFCLGVKDALADICGRFNYESDYKGKMSNGSQVRSLAPTAVYKLVDSAVAYARQFGFPPHVDYHVARHLFGSIDAASCQENFEFGKDGKPLFIAGPYDTPERCRQIRNMLENHCGPDGYHYLLPMDAAGELDSPGEEEEDW